MPRSDFPLIRHLTQTFGPEVAAEWQRPPLVLLPGEGFAENLVKEVGAIEETTETLDRLPWEDVVFDFPHGRGPLVRAAYGPQLKTVADALDRGHLWSRVRPLSTIAKLSATSPWLTEAMAEPFLPRAAECLLIEVWEESTTANAGFAPWPDISLVNRGNPHDAHGWAHVYTNPNCRDESRGFGIAFCNVSACRHWDRIHDCRGSELIMGIGVSLSLLTLGYLLQSEEYPVEVRAPSKRGPDKRAKERPWVREDLPHVILIDPHRVRDYRSEPQGGTHATPSPHQRRGHWRQLRHERFREQRRIWVRPSWIGDTEWTSHGQVYRVLAAPAEAP